MKSPTKPVRYHSLSVSVKTANTIEAYLERFALNLVRADSTLSAFGVQITRPSKYHKGVLSGTHQTLERLYYDLSALMGARQVQAAEELRNFIAALPKDIAAVSPPRERMRTLTSVFLRIPHSSYVAVFNNLKEQSHNRKTGAAVQSYILDLDRLEREPGVFGAKCQDCPLVKNCYVGQDRLSVRRALVKALGGESQSYVELSSIEELLPLLRGRFVRFGTYGDPSALPLDWLKQITPLLSGWTGYTHFYASIDQEYARYYMASVESRASYTAARALGYRVFYVALKGAPPAPVDLLECVYVSKGLTCRECGLCSGNKGRSVSSVRSIWISEH